MTANTKLTSAISKGAALLDENFPGWIDKIDISELDMTDGNTCILGQVYGEYITGKSKLHVLDSHEYGFNGDGYWGSECERVLTNAWKAYIQHRRTGLIIPPAPLVLTVGELKKFVAMFESGLLKEGTFDIRGVDLTIKQAI